jgi:cholest-4-en-3-one 26-monooxygenase
MVAESLDIKPRIAPYDPGFYTGDVRTAFEWLHEHEPIAWCDDRPDHWRPFWLISSFEYARYVSSHPDFFTVHGGVLFSGPPDPERYQLHGPRAATVAGDSRFEGLINFHDTDPPEHAQRRRVVSRFLTPKRIADLEEGIQHTVAEVIERIQPGTEADFVTDVAKPVPLNVTADLLGIPRSDLTDIDRWSESFALASEVGGPDPLPTLVEIYDFLEAQIDHQEVHGGTGLVSHLVTAQRGGELVSRGELLGNLWTIMLGGYNTTRDALSGGVHALLQHPEQAERMVGGQMYRSASEEVLRWVSPARYNARTSTRDTEVGGHTIAAGDFVVVYWYANNRDPKVWADPFEFQIDRAYDREHLAFGFGTHYCIGAALARAEIRQVLEQLFARFPAMRVIGDVPVRPSTLFNLTTSLPLAFAS